MEANNNKPFQIFVKLLDGKTATLRFPTATLPRADAIKQRIQGITRIPTGSQRLICGGAQLSDQSVVSTPESTVHLLLRLVGGKGGFGSLLRGAGNKAGKKKTKNFDACRDMSGRRLRHVNHEKMIEEWKNEEEERKYERLAMEHLKQRAKQGKKGVGDGEAQKYVEEYREESAKCSAEVEMAVREACMNANGKRKGKAKVERLHAKRLKLWIGRLGRSNGSESEDSDEDNDDKAEENQKSVVLNNGNYSGSSKEADGSLDSDAGEKQVGECSGAAFSDGSSKEEIENADDQSPKSEVLHNDGNEMVEPEILKETQGQVAISTGVEAEEVSGAAVVKELAGSDSSSGNGQVLESGLAEVNSSPDSKSGSSEETAVANGNNIELEKPLNFHEYNCAAELEVLGMERLKTELQTRGLKCGGTLQERAARLFLLKSTPLDKLPKKLLAKK